MTNPIGREQALRSFYFTFFIFLAILIAIVANFFYFKYRFKYDIAVQIIACLVSGFLACYKYNTLC